MWESNGTEEEKYITLLKENDCFDQCVEDVKTVLGPFAKHIKENARFIRQKHFRFCPNCIKEGRHYIFHDLAFLDECPVCGATLEENCPHCGEPMYDIADNSILRGFLCRNCKNTFVDVEPEDMFASFLDDNEDKVGELKGVLRKKRSPVIILHSDCYDESPCKNIEIRKFLKEYYLNGKHPRIVACVPRDDCNDYSIIEDTPERMAIGVIDEHIDTDYASNHIFPTTYRSNTAGVYRNIFMEGIRNENISMLAIAKMYDYTIFQPESVYDRGSYQKRPSIYEVFHELEASLYRCDITWSERQKLLSAVFEQWALDVFKHIRDELENYPNIMEKGWLEFRMIPMNIPHYAYMIIEGRKEFTICKTLTGYS